MASTENQTTTDGDRFKGNDGARLIDAFKNYILPLIPESRVHVEATTIGSGLTSEATELLVALQKFVVSLAAKDVHQEADIVKHVSKESISSPIPPQVIRPERPPLLGLILEKARYIVFNKMPIRMLAFNKVGAEIRLVERPEILRIVSQKIEENFHKDKVSRISLGWEDMDLDYDIVEFLDRHCSYAILSHTWLRKSPGEVTFTDWKMKTFDPQQNGYRKLEMFCRVAALDYGINLGWMDTSCIDKTSSAELDESIRSMFRWYHSSAICITYLADTMTLEEMHKDAWFTRGWTLQELIAPRNMKFYRRDWKQMVPKKLNDKKNKLILNEIQKATTITRLEIGYQVYEMHKVSISRRMQWAANRNVTKEEDMAYSLMGIFDVSFSTAYGEGADAAFSRLIQEILNRTNEWSSPVLDVVNWGYGDEGSRLIHNSSKLIQSKPKYYSRGVPNISWYEPYEPVVVTRLGLRVSVLIMPALREKSAHAKKFTPRGNYSATFNILGHFARFIHPVRRTTEEDGSVQYGVYNVLDDCLFDAFGKLTFAVPGDEREDSGMQLFGVLNFEESQTTVTLAGGQTCFALVLISFKDSSASNEEARLRPAYIVSPVTFELKSLRDISKRTKVLKDNLHKHGMSLTTMYL